MKLNNTKTASLFYTPFCMFADPPFLFDGELQTLAEFLACEVADLSEQGLLDWILPEDRNECEKELVSFLQAGEEPELLLTLRKKDGTDFPVFLRGNLLCREDGTKEVHGVMVKAERLSARIQLLKKESEGFRAKLSQAKEMMDTLQIRAEQDSLTKLLNASTARHLAEEYLEKASCCALLVIDMDDFKLINDCYGHMAGDQVLIHAAQAIRNQFRSHDIVGRIGGDEFFVVMKDVSDPGIVRMRCSRVIESVQLFHNDIIKGHPISCSIGAVLSSPSKKDYAELFDRADDALYRAKVLGKNRFEIAE